MEFLTAIDLPNLIPLALILCAGIFIQAAAGFAGGLLIVPALLWYGYSIPAAQCSLLIATIPQNIWGVVNLRDTISPKRVVWPALGRLLFLPLGAWMLISVEKLDVTTIRQIVGGFVLAATIAIMVVRPKPRKSLNPIWGLLAFPISGFFQGLVGMGGPMMVFWVQAHDWSSRQSRGFLFSMYLVSIIPAGVVLYWFFGSQIIAPGIAATMTIPLLMIATFFGLRAGSALGRERLRSVTLALLFLMGLSGLAAPLFR